MILQIVHTKRFFFFLFFFFLFFSFFYRQGCLFCGKCFVTDNMFRCDKLLASYAVRGVSVKIRFLNKHVRNKMDLEPLACEDARTSVHRPYLNIYHFLCLFIHRFFMQIAKALIRILACNPVLSECSMFAQPETYMSPRYFLATFPQATGTESTWDKVD